MVARSKLMAGSYGTKSIEALVVEEGVLLARERGLHQVILETDSLSVVQAFNTRPSHGGLGSIIQGIIGLLESFSSWKVNHLKRDYNKVVHELT